MLKFGIRIVVIAMISLPLLVACDGGVQDCSYWANQLKKKKRVKKAIENLGEQKCKEEGKVLQEQFADSLYRRETLTAAKRIGKTDDTVAIVSSALPDKEVGPLAIRMAIEWKITGLEDALKRLVRARRNAATRKQGLEALVELSKLEEIVDTLVWAVGQEPTLQGVETNAFAADQLAKVDWPKQKKELADVAASNLVRALFMRDVQGNSAQINARMALRTIGSPSMEPLLGAFRGTDKAFNEFAEIRGLPKWRYTQGHELVEMLWDVGDRRASPALMEAIGIALDPPPPDIARLPEDQRDEWKQANSNRLATTALTVGALANDDSVKYAVALLGRNNPPPEASQFVNAGLALALMGTTASRAALWKLFDKGDAEIPKLEAKIKALKAKALAEKNKTKANALKKEHDGLIDQKTIVRDRKANFVTNLAVGMSPGEADKFKAKVLSAKTGPLAESAKQALPNAYYNVLKKCGGNGSCYVKNIKSRLGQLDAVPKAITDAQKALTDPRKKAKKDAKPWTVKIKALTKTFTAKQKELLAFKKKVEKIKKKSPKFNKAVKQFNKMYNEYDAINKKFNPLYAERAKIYKALEPLKKALSDSQFPLYELEKSVLVLGSHPEGKKNLETIAAAFHESKPPYFQQFRQWALISMEHIADKSNIKVMEDLLKKESTGSPSYWTLRLESLIQRVNRSK